MANDRAKWVFPLWLKVSMVVGIVAVAAFLILHLTGNGMAGMHG